jgi:DNA-nicking Smr family endonuclease
VTAGRDRNDDEDRSAFSEAMKGVKPLAGRGKSQPPPRNPVVSRPAPAETPVRFEITHSGERMEGRAPGIDAKQLRRLRSGGVPVDVRVDLHGLRGQRARAAVRAALIGAAEAGQRCVLVIHGRGRGSQDGPVLKQALPDWLAEPPLGARVMAFASATAADGGTGATYVLLRRHAVKNPS